MPVGWYGLFAGFRWQASGLHLTDKHDLANGRPNPVMLPGYSDHGLCLKLFQTPIHVPAKRQVPALHIKFHYFSPPIMRFDSAWDAWWLMNDKPPFRR